MAMAVRDVVYCYLAILLYQGRETVRFSILSPTDNVISQLVSNLIVEAHAAAAVTIAIARTGPCDTHMHSGTIVTFCKASTKCPYLNDDLQL